MLFNIAPPLPFYILGVRKHFRLWNTIWHIDTSLILLVVDSDLYPGELEYATSSYSNSRDF